FPIYSSFLFVFSLYVSLHLRHLHSFPTRRSSDLTEVYLLELMDLLRSRGHEVVLFSMADQRGAPSPFEPYLVPPIDFKAQTETEIGRAHVWTPVTFRSHMPSSA